MIFINKIRALRQSPTHQGANRNGSLDCPRRRKRMVAVMGEFAARWRAGGDATTAAGDMIATARAGGAASSTIKTLGRCIGAAAHYAGLPKRRIALIERSIRRREGVVGGAEEVPEGWLVEVIDRLRRTPGEVEDAVITSIVGGGARYSSVVAMRRGDITPQGGVLIREVKVGGAETRRLYPGPPGCLTDRLKERGAPEGRRRWEERPKLWSRAVTAAAMSRIAPARVMRRAVAQMAEAALGGDFASEIVGHSAQTRATHYSHRPTPGREAWGRHLARLVG